MSNWRLLPSGEVSACSLSKEALRLSVGGDVNVLAPWPPSIARRDVTLWGWGGEYIVFSDLVASFCCNQLTWLHNWWSLQQQLNFCFGNHCDILFLRSIFPSPMSTVNSSRPSCEYCRKGRTGRRAGSYFQKIKSALESRPKTLGVCKNGNPNSYLLKQLGHLLSYVTERDRPQYVLWFCRILAFRASQACTLAPKGGL